MCKAPNLNADAFKRLGRNCFASLCVAVFLVVGFAQEANAVRVSMQRVIFTGKKKSEVITIINNTGKKQTYRLGWKKLRMDEKKSLSSIKEGEPSDDILWAEKMVRYAPRRITVPPGDSQQVRLLLRPPADVQKAEYRAHLWIISEGDPPTFVAKPDSSKQEVRLAVQPAITLPVFVRYGDLDATASISDVKTENIQGGLKIAFALNREGNRSIYGDFDFMCADGAQEIMLRQVRGVAVYTEISRRFVKYEIPFNQSTVSDCKNIKITYRSDPDDPQFQGKVLAEATVTR